MRRLAAAFRDRASSPAAVALTPPCGTHAWLLRADRALHTLLGMKRFPTDDTMRNLFKRFTQGRVVRFYEPLWAWVTAATRGCRSEQQQVDTSAESRFS